MSTSEKVQKTRVVVWQKDDRGGNQTAFAAIDVRAQDESNKLWVRCLGQVFEDCEVLSVPGYGRFQVRLPTGETAWVSEEDMSWGKPL